ncbi:ABC transporter substrate-binding protein [Gluconobacter sp. LMG 1744]|uniref:ABC transporter substrate-binding protein n=1 Tax=Gluconobacter cadivus TaxID=2728101 RepID=UPI00188530F3|nr:ABC transporter substrate-binding protein [Gluconobacter cadivus]MBF0890780.1 ABC transporter substrate-binding protein [Gluconobacter cadivus]
MAFKAFLHVLSAPAAVLLLSGALARSACAGPVRTRIVSLNLCTDELLLELADPSHILGLSPLATDCAESVRCELAQTYPVQRPDGENLVATRPDLVLDGTWHRPTAALVTDALHVPFVQLPSIASLADIPVQIRTVAHAIGEEARGEDMIRAFADRLESLHPAQPEKILTATVIGANLAGEEGGLISDLLKRAGFRLSASERPDGTIALETLIAHPPDLLVTGMISEGASLAENVVRHPALQGRFTGAHRLALPGRLTMCGTPETLAALEALIAAHDRLTAAEPSP